MDLTSWDSMFGFSQSGRRGFGKILPQKAWKNQEWIKTKEKPKTKKVFFLEETKSKKKILRRKTQKRGF